MELDRASLRNTIYNLYVKEHEELGTEGAYRLLDEARRWDLSKTLKKGGVIVFPHAGIADCGHQIAAAVHACLDSCADRVIVLSVLHAFTQEMEDARVRVAQGGDVRKETLWGIQGTGIEGRVKSGAMTTHFTASATYGQPRPHRCASAAPVIERYPYLAGGKLRSPASTSWVAKMQSIVSPRRSHYGIGYNTPRMRRSIRSKAAGSARDDPGGNRHSGNRRLLGL